MKTPILFAVLGMALAAPFPLLAADDHQERGPGHYEWRQVPQVGPRASGPGLKRVWVPAHAQMADCHCKTVMKSAADCGKPMHRMGARPAHRG